MSNAAKLADILKRLGDAHYQAADELIGLANEQPGAAAVPAAPPADDLPEFPPMEQSSRPEPQGSLAVCPKHKRPYKEGKFGPFCTSTTDDPAWANAKGYCTINPKNVDVWLRAQAA